MKHINGITLAILLFMSGIVRGQSVSQIKADPSYVWAEGTGTSVKMADNAALQDLMTEISYSISSENHIRQSNRQTNGTATSKTEFEQVIKTYSTATLNNTQRLIVSEEENKKTGEVLYTIMRFIKKAEIDKIFDSRKQKAIEFTELAHRDLEHLQVSEALRYYYWAWALVQSLRYPNEALVPDENDVMQKADSYLPRCINNVLVELQATVSEHTDNQYYLNFTYKGCAVPAVDYSYFDGADWSVVCNAVDGRGLAELRPSYVPDAIKLQYEYQYFQEAQSDREVQQVLNAVQGRGFPKANVNIPVAVRHSKEAEDTADRHVAVSVNAAKGAANDSYVQAVEQVVEAIEGRKWESVKDLFTAEGYDVYTRLLHYGKAKILGHNELCIDTLASYVYCRSVPMQLSFSNDRCTAENVVFVFDLSGKIDNVQFGLSQVADGDILANPAWSDNAKLVLRNFLENYKTAYALKRIDYLEQVFADDALIITGKVVKKRVGNAETGFRLKKEVKLNKQTKRAYLNNLKHVFASQEFINIKFAKNEVLRVGKDYGELYAIQIKQDYFSTTYGDTGYLFLLVDVNNPNEPVIHIRAWQEMPDPEWGVIGIEHFN